MTASPAADHVTRARKRFRLEGYGMLAFSYVVMGSIGALVMWAPAPESMLLVLRMGFGAVVMLLLFARPRLLAELRKPGVLRLVLIMAVFDSAALLLFFMSMRNTTVAIGMFLIFMSPIWVALLAPRLIGQRTDWVVWPSLVLAMGGLAFILTPSLIGIEIEISLLGVVYGLLGGMCLAVFMIIVSALRKKGVSSSTVVTCELTLDTIILLPLAIVQTWVVGQGLVGRDLISGAILGIVCTAFSYTLWTEGVGRVPVQHVPILGYLEPLTAPLYALVLVGERPSVWAMLGGVLILAAGGLVVWRGEREVEDDEGVAPAAGVVDGAGAPT